MTTPARHLRQVRRRDSLGAMLAVVGLLAWPMPVWAGSQIEEPLVDAVRTALSSAVHNGAPPIPEFADTDSRLRYQRWKGAMIQR
ncbi:MAG: lytic transglycosylase domain-containing protein, partial [Rhodoferax sp.]